MKQKEIIQLSVAGLIFVVAGIVVFSQLSGGGKSSKSKYTYEEVRPIASDFDSKQLLKITDASTVKDFYVPPDLRSGIGNQSPFKPIR